MQENDEAAEHFKIAHEKDPKGKYGQLAVRQCEQLGLPLSSGVSATGREARRRTSG
jgi:hypothetical protein